MRQVEAVYRHGAFEPLEPVSFREEQRVRLSIEAAEPESPQSWLIGLQALQAGVLQRSGPLPDSAPDISADRLR